MLDEYLPEGYVTTFRYTANALQNAMRAGTVVEGRVILCDAEHNLIVDFGCMRGFIPREEAAIGIRSGETRDIAIMSRVGKPVCAKVMRIETGPDGAPRAILSRRLVQEEARYALLQKLRPGMVRPARVTHMEPFGVFVDIGRGIVSFIGIENLSVSRSSHPNERMTVGQDIFVVVSGVDEQMGRVYLSHKELLGTWEENASRFEVGQTAPGIVRSLTSYGAFIELTPNLSGLAERQSTLKIGSHVSVYIKLILPDRMKVKLTVVDVWEEPPVPLSAKDYYITSGQIEKWRYSPASCEFKVVETDFTTPTVM